MDQIKTRIYAPELVPRDILEKIEQFLFPANLSERSIYRRYSPYSHQIIIFKSSYIVATLRVIDGSEHRNLLPIEFAVTESGKRLKIDRPTCEIGGFKIAPLPHRERFIILKKAMDMAEDHAHKIGAKSAWITCRPDFIPLYSRYKFLERARVYYSSGEYSALYREASAN
jgi:hypothetical protein